MHKPESVPESQTHKILWDFEMQTDHPITTRIPDQVLMNKKKELTISGISLFQWNTE